MLPSPDGGADGEDIPPNHRQKEAIVPNKASYKSKGGNKDAATKHALNVPSGGREPDVESEGRRSRIQSGRSVSSATRASHRS
jgi:hypothetical protein